MTIRRRVRGIRMNSPSMQCFSEFKQELKKSMMQRKKDKIDIRNKFLSEIFNKMKQQFQNPPNISQIREYDVSEDKRRATTATMATQKDLEDRRSYSTLSSKIHIPENQADLPSSIPELMRLSTKLKKTLIENLSTLPETLKKFIESYDKSMKYLGQKKISPIDSFFF